MSEYGHMWRIIYILPVKKNPWQLVTVSCDEMLQLEFRIEDKGVIQLCF